MIRPDAVGGERPVVQIGIWDETQGQLVAIHIDIWSPESLQSFRDGSTGYPAWCYTVPTSMSSPHATRTVLFPFVANKPMMKPAQQVRMLELPPFPSGIS